MTPFEFVFALISIITSLALTQIITGVVGIIRHRDRAGFSLTHALWMWVAFVVVIGNWGALWSVRLEADWPAFRVLAWLTSMTTLYAFCALVVPDVEPGTALNLQEFHERDGKRYIIVHNLFAVIAMFLVLTLGSPSAQPWLFLPPVAALALGTVALVTRGRVQLASSILLALMATAFMLSNVSVLST